MFLFTWVIQYLMIKVGNEYNKKKLYWFVTVILYLKISIVVFTTIYNGL